MVIQKKAISPVVATALLLVVAVVAVVGFQSWFTTYQSGVNVKVEQESAAGSAITIERLENGTVYIKNGGTTNITITDIEVTAKTGYTGSCDTPSPTYLNPSVVSTITLDCDGTDLSKDDVYNVVVITPKGVFSAEAIAR